MKNSWLKLNLNKKEVMLVGSGKYFEELKAMVLSPLDEEGSGCKLCPRDWLLHGDKCYWLSKERKDWTGSRDDCSGKSAHMLVIQNQEEMSYQSQEQAFNGSTKGALACYSVFTPTPLLCTSQDFIQNVTQGASYVWIGLNMTSPGGKWTWVDGSPLDHARFPVSSSADGKSCGRIKGSRIYSESCRAEQKWICQKEAAVI
ncbi:killer cell lectin-like receptor subfamily F member 1 [Chrysemys picta bellii]|uniref:killer cell lectin-like receptor subfamily F member 1 n=1 Tax=Chrysemys picta bellii TaxID=8478 RepID=UPI0032B12CFE